MGTFIINENYASLGFVDRPLADFFVSLSPLFAEDEHRLLDNRLSHIQPFSRN